MESYNPLKRKDLEPEDTNHSKHVKLNNESNQSIELYSPSTCVPDPASNMDDEQILVCAKQPLEAHEGSNAIENIDSQNIDQLLSIDVEILPMFHIIDDAIFTLASKNEHHSKSLDEMDDTQYINGRINTEEAQLFRTDLIAVIKAFESNKDEINARKYRNLLHQASRQYGRNDIVWFTGEKIGFKATEEDIETSKKYPGKLLGQFSGFLYNYKTSRRKTVRSIPVKKPVQSKVEMDHMQHNKRHIDKEGAQLFRTDLMTVIKEFEKNNDTVNASTYYDLFHQASQYDSNDIVWFTGEKIGFRATDP